jgi:predicted dehydrogenase
MSERRRFMKELLGWGAAASAVSLMGSAQTAGAQAPTAGAGKKLGFALVGLGSLSGNQIAPALLEKTKLCKLTGLVSGHPDKAKEWARKYSVPEKNIYDYQNFDQIKNNPDIDVVYVVLPNSMHAEYTVRAAQAGKHVLCEKPMATSVADCQRMIEASRKAAKKLMVAYRLQYEPYNREAIRLARAGELGKLKSLRATNGQAQGDPHQWRLKKALAGGGALPDVGIYCLNAARYLSGEEPTEVSATITTTPNDPRFTEVEEQMDFLLRFPSGFVASCTTSYGFHDSKEFRLIGSTGWLELDPAFPYKGQQMRIGRKVSAGAPSAGAIEQRQLQAKDHFALEMDHLATRIREDKPPHTGGEEGLQDMRIIAALYDSARSGRRVSLHAPAQKDAFRGPPPG